jgi:hypothetical protein
MRIPFFVVTTLICAGIGCGETTNVDDLFDPSPAGASGKGGAGGQTGGTGGVGGATTGGTGGAATGGMGGVGGTGGAGAGGTAGTGTTGGAAGTAGASGTGGSAGSIIDAGTDVRRDAAADVRDAGGKGSIRCGSLTCDPAAAFCCLTNNNIRCVSPTATTCVASSDRIHCDDTADCAAGQICCVTEGANGNGSDAVCTLTTSCLAPKQMLCDPTVAIPCLGLANFVCSANGSGFISDYSYCHAP